MTAAPRIYLTTLPIGDPAAVVTALPELIGRVDAAAVLVRFADADDAVLIQRGKVVATAIQNAGAAMLIEGRYDLVAPTGADGAHLVDLTRLDEALPALKPDRIAGVAGLASRHDAMLAGERADYVMFGEPSANGTRPALDAIVERMSWWSEIFEVPCVGYAATQEEALAIARTKAEFVCLGGFIWDDPRGPHAALIDVRDAIGHIS